MIRKAKATQFDFLGLPAELRNLIYELLLCVDGPIHPSKKAPSTAGKKTLRDEIQNDNSALCLLAVNKQIRDEAVGIFYAAPLVFYFPTQFHAFIQDLTSLRRSVIKDVTIHYDNTKRGGIDVAALNFPLLRELSGLKRLSIIMEGTLYSKIRTRGSWSGLGWQMDCANPSVIPGLKVLFSLRGLEEIQVRDTELEEEHTKAEKDKEYPDFTTQSRSYHIVKLTAALQHFNAALLLAQRGLTNEELLANNKWHTWDEFPELPEPEEEEEEEDDEEEADSDEKLENSEGDSVIGTGPTDDQAIQAISVPTTDTIAALTNGTAMATTGSRRSARISEKLAKAQLVIDYNENDEDDFTQEQDEEEDTGDDIVVYRGRAVSVEL